MYGSWLEGISDDYNWQNDATQAVITRSMVEDIWVQLTPQEQAAVLAADNTLIENWERVAESMLDPKEYPRTHWWWYLDEGPQVREEAHIVTARN
jgi:hypothetical protein